MILESMNETMVHRGPDGGGIWADPRGRCFLGHRRLSIIDTSDAGRQPMTSPDGRWTITFNGEIYNFLELKLELEARGVSFRGRTDTEVLLAAIQEWGIESLPRLDGMYAFAAYNLDTGQMLLARDPFGEKPLYFMELPNGGFAFASELQALEKLPGFDGEVSVDAMAEVLMFQYIGAPRTIYRKVRKLLPAHWLLLDPVRPPKMGRYFEFRPGRKTAERSVADLADEAEDILVRSIKRRMITDVPLGAFLSGGVDSSTVCALVRKKLNLPLKTFSIGFDGAAESEHLMARQFSAHLGTEHYDQILTPNASDFLYHAGNLLDEPNADSSCLPTYLLSGFARQQVTVALSGDGGDELFMGYGRYFDTVDDEIRGNSKGNPWSPGEAYYSGRILVTLENRIRELFGFVPELLNDHLARLRAEIDSGEAPVFCRLRKSDVENYLPGAVLPKVDRMSMRHSLEVRTPFLSMELARFSEGLALDACYANGKGKRVLREIAYRYLPRELIDMPKKGFGLPMSGWAKQDLLRVAGELLLGSESRLAGALGRSSLDQFLARQAQENGFVAYQVWALTMLESWLRAHPVKLPDLEIKETRVRASNKSWAALDMGHRRFAVFKSWQDDESADSNQAKNVGFEDSDRRRLECMASVLSTRYPHAHFPLGAAESKAILIAKEGHQKPGTSELLKGCALYFPNINPTLELSDRDLKLFSNTGARELLFFHPQRSDESLFRLRFSNPRKWMRLAWALKHAFRHIPVMWGGNGKVRGAGDAEMVVSPEYGLLHTDGATDSINRWLVFNGNEQLPPIPSRFSEIPITQGTRYLVKDRRLWIKASRSGMLRKVIPVWAMPHHPILHKYLDYIPEIIPGYSGGTLASVVAENKEFFDALSSWIASSDRAADTVAAPLKPGDRVIVMTHGLAPGGAERQWCYLAKGLVARGYHVTFVISMNMEGSNGHYLPLLKGSGIEVVQLCPPSVKLPPYPSLRIDSARTDILESQSNPFGDRLINLFRVFTHLQPKAVFAQLDDPNIHAAAAGLLAGVPRIVISFRNYNPTRFSYLNLNWFKPGYQTIARSRKVIFTGNSTAANKDYADWIGMPAGRVACIPNAIEIPGEQDGANADRLRVELGLKAGQPVLLGVFRLSEEKRPLLFLEICGQLAQQHPSLKVLVAGIGPSQKRMEDWIRASGHSDTFRLLGLRDDVISLMRISSLLLLCSTLEGMPNVILEAQSVGLPVVATNVGGVPDCVRHEETGFIHEIDDVAGLAESCAKLLATPTLRASMGTAAIDRMKQGYSIDALTDRYLSLLQ